MTFAGLVVVLIVVWAAWPGISRALQAPPALGGSKTTLACQTGDHKDCWWPHLGSWPGDNFCACPCHHRPPREAT